MYAKLKAETDSASPGLEVVSSLKRPRPDDLVEEEPPTSRLKFDDPPPPASGDGMSTEERATIMREVQAEWNDVAFYSEALKIGNEAMGRSLSQVIYCLLC